MFLRAKIFLHTPTAPIPPVILVPITMSPPILRVDPAVIGTPVNSETAEIPDIKSKSFPTSESSPRWTSTKIDIGFAPG